MNYKMLFYLYGIIAYIEAALLLFPMLVAIIYGESVFPFLITIGILLVFAIPLTIKKPQNKRIYAKEGFLCVAGSWLLMALFGALPPFLSEAIPNYIDSFFEIVSGLTTTGASILTSIENLPKGILFWRSFTHWIGGMGVLVFMIAILPSQDGQAIHIMNAEVPGPTKGKLVPKIRNTALILYSIYIDFTVAEIIALLCTGMPFYDALVNTFATVGTGGFSVKNASIASYNNPAAEWVMAIFMFLCGVNFNLYYFLLSKRVKEFFKNAEFKVYSLICLASTIFICINIYSTCDSLATCIRTSFFQVTTIMSTAGFSTVDFNLWPSFSKAVLVFLMFLGGCAGSTAGGLKISRMMILVKNFAREIKQLLHPKSVNVVRMEGEVLSCERSTSALTYFATYIGFILISFVLVSLDGFDFETNITACISCFNNVGPGLSLVGPMGNYSAFSWLSKIVLSFSMLFGRLEIIPMCIFLMPTTWFKK